MREFWYAFSDDVYLWITLGSMILLGIQSFILFIVMTILWPMRPVEWGVWLKALALTVITVRVILAWVVRRPDTLPPFELWGALSWALLAVAASVMLWATIVEWVVPMFRFRWRRGPEPPWRKR